MFLSHLLSSNKSENQGEPKYTHMQKRSNNDIMIYNDEGPEEMQYSSEFPKYGNNYFSHF